MMNFQEYIQIQFYRDVTTLEFKVPNSVIMSHPESFRVDAQTVFFGGPNFERMAGDLSRVNPENQVHFILGLFTIFMEDQAMFMHYRSKLQCSSSGQAISQVWLEWFRSAS